MPLTDAPLAREGNIVNMLRVDTPGCPEKAAIVTRSPDGKTAAFEDDADGARNNHHANFMTFHRWKDFRKLSSADSVAMPEIAR